MKRQYYPEPSFEVHSPVCYDVFGATEFDNPMVSKYYAKALFVLLKQLCRLLYAGCEFIVMNGMVKYRCLGIVWQKETKAAVVVIHYKSRFKLFEMDKVQEVYEPEGDTNELIKECEELFNKWVLETATTVSIELKRSAEESAKAKRSEYTGDESSGVKRLKFSKDTGDTGTVLDHLSILEEKLRQGTDLSPVNSRIPARGRGRRPSNPTLGSTESGWKISAPVASTSTTSTESSRSSPSPANASSATPSPSTPTSSTTSSSSSMSTASIPTLPTTLLSSLPTLTSSLATNPLLASLPLSTASLPTLPTLTTPSVSLPMQSPYASPLISALLGTPGLLQPSPSLATLPLSPLAQSLLLRQSILPYLQALRNAEQLAQLSNLLSQLPLSQPSLASLGSQPLSPEHLQASQDLISLLQKNLANNESSKK